MSEEQAREIILAGYNACGGGSSCGRITCDCDLAAIDGCKARVRVISEALAAARTAGRVQQARRDADFIDANMVCIGSQGPVFHPRGNSGNTIGLDYSAAIRAEADRIEKGGE